jgi:hypothetical protein
MGKEACMSFYLMFMPLFALANQIPSCPRAASPGPLFPRVVNEGIPNLRSFITEDSHSWLPFGWETIRGGNYFISVFENDSMSHEAIIGPSMGLNSNWYLGNGFAFTLAWGLPDLKSAIGIDWYPIEGVDFSVSVDLFWRQVRFGWEVESPENFLSLLNPVVVFYWVAYWIESEQ